MQYIIPNACSDEGIAIIINLCIQEPVHDQLKSPTESLDPSPIITTPSSEIHHHVHFLDQPKYLDPPPPRKSILSKPLNPPVNSEEGEYQNIHDSRLDRDDEDEDEEIVEPEGGAEVSKADSIPLSKPIQYTGPSSKLTAWYPIMHMDPKLSQFPGCHPDVDERKVMIISSVSVCLIDSILMNSLSIIILGDFIIATCKISTFFRCF